MVDKARCHEVSVSYLAYGFKLVAVGVEGNLAVVGVPRCVGRVYHGIGLVKRVVPKYVRVAVGDADVILVDVHRRRVVKLAQRHVDMLCVAHEWHCSVRGAVSAVGVHLHGFGEHPVPKGVKRQAVVLYRVIGLAVGTGHRGALVEVDLEACHRCACRHVATHELGAVCTEHISIGLLPCEGDKLVAPRCEVGNVHGVSRVGKRGHPSRVAFLLCFYKVAALVEDVERDRPDMVVEHVGALQVVVVLEVDVKTVGAVA